MSSPWLQAVGSKMLYSEWGIEVISLVILPSMKKFTCSFLAKTLACSLLARFQHRYWIISHSSEIAPVVSVQCSTLFFASYIKLSQRVVIISCCLLSQMYLLWVVSAFMCVQKGSCSKIYISKSGPQKLGWRRLSMPPLCHLTPFMMQTSRRKEKKKKACDPMILQKLCLYVTVYNISSLQPVEHQH